MNGQSAFQKLAGGVGALLFSHNPPPVIAEFFRPDAYRTLLDYLRENIRNLATTGF